MPVNTKHQWYILKTSQSDQSNQKNTKRLSHHMSRNTSPPPPPHTHTINTHTKRLSISSGRKQKHVRNSHCQGQLLWRWRCWLRRARTQTPEFGSYFERMMERPRCGILPQSPGMNQSCWGRSHRTPRFQAVTENIARLFSLLHLNSKIHPVATIFLHTHKYLCTCGISYSYAWQPFFCTHVNICALVTSPTTMCGKSFPAHM